MESGIEREKDNILFVRNMAAGLAQEKWHLVKV